MIVKLKKYPGLKFERIKGGKFADKALDDGRVVVVCAYTGVTHVGLREHVKGRKSSDVSIYYNGRKQTKLVYFAEVKNNEI